MSKTSLYTSRVHVVTFYNRVAALLHEPATHPHIKTFIKLPFSSCNKNITSCETDCLNISAKGHHKDKKLNHCPAWNKRSKGQLTHPQVSHLQLDIYQWACCWNVESSKLHIIGWLVGWLVGWSDGVLRSDQCYLRGSGSRLKAARSRERERERERGGGTD